MATIYRAVDWPSGSYFLADPHAPILPGGSVDGPIQLPHFFRKEFLLDTDLVSIGDVIRIQWRYGNSLGGMLEMRTVRTSLDQDGRRAQAVLKVQKDGMAYRGCIREGRDAAWTTDAS